MSKRPAEGTPQDGARKRAKFDEDDIDWLIGDLRKEESQLIITRLVKVFTCSSPPPSLLFSFSHRFFRLLVKIIFEPKSIRSVMDANSTARNKSKSKWNSWPNFVNFNPPLLPTVQGWKVSTGTQCSWDPLGPPVLVVSRHPWPPELKGFPARGLKGYKVELRMLSRRISTRTSKFRFSFLFFSFLFFSFLFLDLFSKKKFLYSNQRPLSGRCC